MGYQEPNNLFKYPIYPNPFTTDIWVSFPNDYERTIEIYNTMGSIVYEIKVNSLEENFYLGELIDGIYILKVTERLNTINTQKLIKF